MNRRELLIFCSFLLGIFDSLNVFESLTPEAILVSLRLRLQDHPTMSCL